MEKIKIRAGQFLHHHSTQLVGDELVSHVSDEGERKKFAGSRAFAVGESAAARFPEEIVREDLLELL